MGRRVDYIDDPNAPKANSVVPSVVAMREVKEETGYDVEVTGLTGTYTNPKHVMAYEDGEVRQQFSIAFRARLVGGAARTSRESRRVEWVAPNDVDELEMHPSMRLRLAHGLAGGAPHIG